MLVATIIKSTFSSSQDLTAAPLDHQPVRHIAGFTLVILPGPTQDIVAGLAKHVRKDLESTYTLAESGTAGPTGGQTPNRKPGYVALAVDCERGCFTRELNTELGGDRVANMIRFTIEALTLLKEVIEGKAKL